MPRPGRRPVADESWAELAGAARQALALLGYGTPDCLPGGAAPCGGTWAEHAAAGLAALKAVADHHLAHLAPPELMTSTVYEAVAATIECDCGQLCA